MACSNVLQYALTPSGELCQMVCLEVQAGFANVVLTLAAPCLSLLHSFRVLLAGLGTQKVSAIQNPEVVSKGPQI
jgi:hypothetical protein